MTQHRMIGDRDQSPLAQRAVMVYGNNLPTGSGRDFVRKARTISLAAGRNPNTPYVITLYMYDIDR